MAIPLFLRTIEETSLSMWIRDTPSLFGYWFILTLHAIGMTMLVGASAVLDCASSTSHPIYRSRRSGNCTP